MDLKGVLLDVDGTLVLSNDAHAQAWVDAFVRYGYTVEFAQVRRLIGMGGDKLMPKIVPGLSDEEGKGKEISSYRREHFKRHYLSSLAPAPGARELLQHLRDQGLRLVVASSAKEDELEGLLRVGRIDDLIEMTTSSSDAENSKPDSDIVQVALDKAGFKSAEALMLGDTPYDVQAAAGCGVGLIAVRCGGFTDKELRGALAIYDDPADLLAQYTQSPFIR